MATNNPINLTAAGIVSYNGAGTFAGRTLTAGSGVTITNGNGVAGNPTISAGVTVPTTFTGDVGTATPAANNINLVGTSAQGLSTSASGSTVTFTNANATTAQKGVLTLATNAEAIAGTDTAKAITSDDLKAKLGTQTNHGVALGQGTTSALAYTSVGLTNTVLLGNTGADPSFGAVPNAALSNSTITLTQPAAGMTISGSPVALGGTATFALADDLAALEGLNTTGVASRTSVSTWVTSSITNNAIIVGSTSQGLQNLGPLTNGQLLIGSTGSAPVAASLTAGSNITITPGAGTITIASSASGGITWVEETTTSRALIVNQGVVVNNSGTVTCTLPVTAALGDTIQLYGKGAGLIRVAQNAGQQIRGLSTTTTLGASGRVDAQAQGTWIELVCITANTTFGMRAYGTVTLT